ncbi:MarR family transcriptional regulator [Prodigiosinella confusarubida]|uniref:MarR family transcriptional regulator n=1 Tax=Serratia sp. (strain ATCC 39006) TaxID=104623 RepID=A0A2I5TBK0_SERS3|nr:MarR family transcriptional regulator [Serratia sp. ATCC 39006]AUH01957.1 MarR family transcriptional regulator [Serratia sp. ATCC 39006]AUH06279.1 MarR family transcriptional regulator [Serratia sp. ATCC 39006]
MTKVLGNIPFHLMRQLFQEHTSLWQKLLPELTKQQYVVLCVVAEQPGIEQMDLIDAALSTKATLAEMLKRMEKKGLLVRHQRDDDKRRRFIFLTDEGLQVLQRARPVANDIDAAFLSRISANQRDDLVCLLQAMLDT